MSADRGRYEVEKAKETVNAAKYLLKDNSHSLQLGSNFCSLGHYFYNNAK